MLSKLEIENLIALLQSEEERDWEVALLVSENRNISNSDLLKLLTNHFYVYKLLFAGERINSNYSYKGFSKKRKILHSYLLTILINLSNKNQYILIKNFFSKTNNFFLPSTRFEELPEIFFRFPDIDKIIYPLGNLKKIDDRILYFKKLKELDLNQQPLEFISPKLANLPNLRLLRLGSSGFLPEELAEKENLEIEIVGGAY